MLELTVSQLSSILPNNKEINKWYEAMIKILPKYGITTDKRLAAFLSQTSHESLDYTVLSENLNYSATGLNTVFPRYFKNAGRDATQYARQPEKIANVVYDDANRSINGKLGNTEQGDGWKYRGRGIIQLTGKNNYIAFAKDIDMTLEEAVDYVQTKEGALESAAWFWKERNINVVADTSDVVAVTKLVNGGTHGLADRTIKYNRAIKILNSSNVQSHVIDENKVEPVVVKNKLPIIKLGSNGEAVSRVQLYLKIPVTGIFDQKTHDSVVKWQKYNGLSVDGVVGPNTYKKMNIS
jgi:putative chitinase